ncbi:hypothetical protein [Clavibacter michiganensis]|uniref:Uncharacterized protein n=2 Tax=Clavibacter michiganensis subsp. insidiosus TaxID=33014 RepID=A0A0D5CFP7_9MICO|nr:hypothetical protein [Clavibacter michiganensis]AJW78077.1 hypothetical protein VO01_02095 [Clavibacter michiganensis subsp. insidiosus]AWF99535.1 hypothetical protein BEH61_13590 [Clavibacter michiganensis subsp. insidiosus]AWG00344.1 hypothetical protein BEH62_01875 [Clavibacter michiganensis subsp. insidiosus]OQJ61022.1 hypothetical protein B5P21_14685 [Clavibacter michiganensis subsp. insidiosus]RMC85835.1 hypothetical protein CmiCFBP2404_06965 [Clavibacter michiganensis subsp. insidios
MDDDDRRAEIAELRRRVFGPDRDPRDADSLARLRELEERVASPDDTAATADPAPGEPGADVPADGGPSVASRSRAREARGRRIRPRLAAAWAASLVIVAAAAAGGTAWWLGDARGTVATLALEPPPVPDNATYLSVDTGSIAPGSLFAAFQGISVARIPVPDAVTGVEETCLVAGPTEQDGAVSGVPGCATGAVPARTALVVTADQPQELRDAFPLGTTLTFELDDDGETVRVRTVGG